MLQAVKDYIATLDEPQRRALLRIRDTMLEIAPDAEERISYGMPGFHYKGKYLGGYYAFKDHLSFFPAGIVPDFQDVLTGFTTSKGTVQFTVDHEIPGDVVRAMITARKDAIDAGNS